MKRVLLVPVLHNAAELGSLAAPVEAHYRQRLGPAAWTERERVVRRLWDDARRALAALPLDYARVRIYQDGLPVCGREMEIVRELAAAGSLNHQVVLELIGRGAMLMGTEDPQLLIREYELQRRRLGAASPAAAPAAAGPAEAAALLAARDRFIAERIAATLGQDETGIVFLGAAHRLDALGALGVEATVLGMAR
jgi:hypothetical protein